MTQVGKEQGTFGAVGAWWARLAERERRLVLTLLGTAAFLVAALVWYLVSSGLTEIEERNVAMREALHVLDVKRDVLLARRRESSQIEVRMGRAPPALGGLLEQTAQAVGIQIPEATERPPTPRGTRYLQRSIDVKLRGVTLEPLTELMRRLETGPHVIVVERLDVRARYNQHDLLDAELTVASYERAEGADKAAARRPPGGAL